MGKAQENRWHCGCCGGELESQGDIWCERCKTHVDNHVPFEEGTWFAKHNEDCPFDVR